MRPGGSAVPSAQIHANDVPLTIAIVGRLPNILPLTGSLIKHSFLIATESSHEIRLIHTVCVPRLDAIFSDLMRLEVEVLLALIVGVGGVSTSWCR
jgi:hypothetical protein